VQARVLHLGQEPIERAYLLHACTLQVTPIEFYLRACPSLPKIDVESGWPGLALGLGEEFVGAGVARGAQSGRTPPCNGEPQLTSIKREGDMQTTRIGGPRRQAVNMLPALASPGGGSPRHGAIRSGLVYGVLAFSGHRFAARYVPGRRSVGSESCHRKPFVEIKPRIDQTAEESVCGSRVREQRAMLSLKNMLYGLMA
jgi:hypothetical protein